MRIWRPSVWLAAIPCAWTTFVHADLADTVARVKPSVVIVGTYRATDAPRFRLRGTGFVVGNGNLVATSFHVIPDASENQADRALVVQVRGENDQLSMRQATVLESDRARDLAIMQIEGPAVAPLTVRDSDTVRDRLGAPWDTRRSRIAASFRRSLLRYCRRPVPANSPTPPSVGCGRAPSTSSNSMPPPIPATVAALCSTLSLARCSGLSTWCCSRERASRHSASPLASATRYPPTS